MATTPAGEDADLLRLAVRRRLVDTRTAERIRASARSGGSRAGQLLVEGGYLTAYGLDLLREDATALRRRPRIPGYKLLARLGAGGMGTVYRALHRASGTAVALKVMLPGLALRKGFTERFLREAESLSALDHPHLLRCLAYGVEGGELWMALELMTGGDAEQLLRRNGGRLGWMRAVEVVRDACCGAGAIHRAGLVHRDIKPANIFLDAVGRAKLADLGLAREGDMEDYLARTGMAMGTPAFMSPEQAKGGVVDLRTDLYALGATLYCLVTGDDPFLGANSVEVVERVANEELGDPRDKAPQVPAGVAAIIRRATSKDPARRYQHADELQAELDHLLDGDLRPPPASRRSAVRSLRSIPPPPRSRRLVLGSALACLLAALGAAWWMLPRALPAPPAQPPPTPVALPPPPMDRPTQPAPPAAWTGLRLPIPGPTDAGLDFLRQAGWEAGGVGLRRDGERPCLFLPCPPARQARLQGMCTAPPEGFPRQVTVHLIFRLLPASGQPSRDPLLQVQLRLLHAPPRSPVTRVVFDLAGETPGDWQERRSEPLDIPPGTLALGLHLIHRMPGTQCELRALSLEESR